MRKLLFISILIFLGIQWQGVQAQQVDHGISISHHVIDEQVKARDILKYNIEIVNNSEHKVTIYAMVNDVSMTEGRQEFISPTKLDRTTSVARWIKFKRGVIDLWPGEKEVVPLEIDVSYDAVPGKRYAAITFPDGPHRQGAESNMQSKSFPELMINLEVVEEIIERAQTQSFKTSRDIFLSFPVEFSVNIVNNGNRAIIPQGSIYIYNRQGQEVMQLPVNENKEAIDVEHNKDFVIAWSEGKGFGKYKARLEVEYGQEDKRDIQDTIYFWILPLPMLLIFGGGLLIATILLVFIIFRKTYQTQHLPEPGGPINNGILDLKNKK